MGAITESISRQWNPLWHRNCEKPPREAAVSRLHLDDWQVAQGDEIAALRANSEPLEVLVVIIFMVNAMNRRDAL